MTETITAITLTSGVLLAVFAYYNFRWRRHLKNVAEINLNF